MKIFVVEVFTGGLGWHTSDYTLEEVALGMEGVKGRYTRNTIELIGGMSVGIV